MPDVGGLLGADAVTLWLVEVQDQRLVAVEDPLPFITLCLLNKVDHGPERSPALKLWWDPCVPVSN
jgi:hypothetical protein